MAKGKGYPTRLKILTLLTAFASCLGPSPSAPPAPPAEIPSSLTFPPTVGIDVSKVSSEIPTDSSNISALTGDGPLKFVISEGANLSTAFNNLLDEFLSPLTDVQIPVDPAVTVFHYFNTSDPPLEIKIDFTPFDLDGDGVVEPCTGSTCPVKGTSPPSACPSEAPVADLKQVCFRIWTKKASDAAFQRLMAGTYDTLPVKDDPDTEDNEENLGKGRFRIGRIQENITEISDIIVLADPGEYPFTRRNLFGVDYDHQDPSHVQTEIYNILDLINAQNETRFIALQHLLTVQLGKTDPSGAAYLEKTVNLRRDVVVEPHFLAESPEGLRQEERTIGRFREDTDFWSGSLFIDDPFEPVSVPTTCARISTASEVPQEDCIDLGIDTTGEPFVAPATVTDALFPEDFPENPTF